MTSKETVRTVLEKLFNEGYVCGIDGDDPMRSRDDEVYLALKKFKKMVEGTKQAYVDYLTKHPEIPFRVQMEINAMKTIDTIAKLFMENDDV